MNRKMSARDAQRRYLNNGGKTTERLFEDIRTQTAETMQLCIWTALKSCDGVSGKIKDIAGWADRFSAMYIDEQKNLGAGAAKKKLKELSDPLLPNGFFLPAVKLPEKKRDIHILAAQQQAAEMTVRLYALAINKSLSSDGQYIDRIMKLAGDIYREKAKETGNR